MSDETDYLRQLLHTLEYEDAAQQAFFGLVTSDPHDPDAGELLARTLTAPERLPRPSEGSSFTRLYRDCLALLEQGVAIVRAVRRDEAAMQAALRDWGEQRQLVYAQFTRELDAEDRRFRDARDAPPEQ